MCQRTAVIDRRYRNIPARSVIPGDRVPVDHVPPGFDIIGPAVLVIQVVGVLPNIDAENRCITVHERTVLVRRRDDFELATLVLDQPRPTAAETADARGGQFLLESIEATAGGLDIVG